MDVTEIRAKSLEELKDLLVKCRQSLFSANFTKMQAQDKDTAKFTRLKKTIARILMVMTEIEGQKSLRSKEIKDV